MNFSNSQLISLLTVIIFLECNQKKQKVVRSNKANNILIFTDNQGYRDLGYFVSPNVKTPIIDRILSGGLEVTQLCNLETNLSKKHEKLEQHPKITNKLLQEAQYFYNELYRFNNQMSHTLVSLSILLYCSIGIYQ